MVEVGEPEISKLQHYNLQLPFRIEDINQCVPDLLHCIQSSPVAVFNYHRVPEQLVNLITVKILVSVWHRDRYQLCMKAQI